MHSEWERVAGDPALADAVRRRYTGSGDVLDQLWWADHPGVPTADGRADPATALERERQRLYRPGAASSDADELERAAAGIARDRDAARAALRAEDAERRARRPGTTAPGRRSPSRRLLAGAVVAALLVGGAAGFGAGRFLRPDGPRALRVFERAQREADRPPSAAPLPPSVRPATLRAVGTAATSGTALYAARARNGQVCLVAIVLATHYDATCTTDAAFADAGLTLAFQAVVDPGGGTPRAAQHISVTWLPDGAVRF